MTRGVLIWSLLGPLIFLVVVVGFSVAAGLAGVPSDKIGEAVAAQGSAVLLVASGALAAAVLTLPLRTIWRGPVTAADVGLGAALGLALALAYIWGLAPALTWAQSQFGDYVPAGAVGRTVGSDLVLFFAANVVLAPMVEETVYRGYLLPRMMQRWGAGLGILASCLCFGMLHWLGGVWYMALTGIVAGGLFAALRLWRGTLIAPFAAHFTLNLAEFMAAALR